MYGCALPQILRTELVMPQAPMNIDALVKIFDLNADSPLEFFDPDQSDWVGRSVYINFVENSQNNGIWLMRGKDVGECDDFDRFVEIVSHKPSMPSLEASMAKTLDDAVQVVGRDDTREEEVDELALRPFRPLKVNRPIFIVWWSQVSASALMDCSWIDDWSVSPGKRESWHHRGLNCSRCSRRCRSVYTGWTHSSRLWV